VAAQTPNLAGGSNRSEATGIPGSSVPPHPTGGIPLPAHGFEALDASTAAMAALPAADVIGRAARVLMSAAAEKLGLHPGQEPDLDLPDARRLITALAGLVAAVQGDLGEDAEPLQAGVRTLQNAFREASARPDAPGEGPGEQLLS
jgi:hypothetical protein